MNTAIIFAGGTGQRMNSRSLPKQFLELNAKPIIIYTLEHFEKHELIDSIIVVCVETWIDYCISLMDKFHITKVKAVIPGGKTGLLSRYEGVKKASELYDDDTICLMHDGVRPMIDSAVITRCIESVEKYGSGITVAPAVETIALKIDDTNKVGRIIDRQFCQMAKAPQSFLLGDLFKVHKKAVESGMIDCIDTAYLMQQNGYDLYTVEGPMDNIKITTPADFYTFSALMGIREKSKISDV